MKIEAPSPKDAIVDWVLMTAAMAFIYVVSHAGDHVQAEVIGASLALASGLVWALSASLPGRPRRLAKKANFIAASLAAMSAVCLLP